MVKADKGVKTIATRTTRSQILAAPEIEEDELQALTLCRVGDMVKKNGHETRRTSFKL